MGWLDWHSRIMPDRVPSPLKLCPTVGQRSAEHQGGLRGSATCPLMSCPCSSRCPCAQGKLWPKCRHKPSDFPLAWDAADHLVLRYCFK